MRPSYLRPRDRGNYKESAGCPITKASYSSHFHIPLIFLFSTFPAMQYQRFFSLFDTFSHLRNVKNAFSVELLYHKDNMFRPLNKVKLLYAKVDKMLVVSGTNQGFWSHFGCWRRNITIFCCQSIV